MKRLIGAFLPLGFQQGLRLPSVVSLLILSLFTVFPVCKFHAANDPSAPMALGSTVAVDHQHALDESAAAVLGLEESLAIGWRDLKKLSIALRNCADRLEKNLYLFESLSTSEFKEELKELENKYSDHAYKVQVYGHAQGTTLQTVKSRMEELRQVIRANKRAQDEAFEEKEKILQEIAIVTQTFQQLEQNQHQGFERLKQALAAHRNLEFSGSDARPGSLTYQYRLREKALEEAIALHQTMSDLRKVRGDIIQVLAQEISVLRHLYSPLAFSNDVGLTIREKISQLPDTPRLSELDAQVRHHRQAKLDAEKKHQTIEAGWQSRRQRGSLSRAEQQEWEAIQLLKARLMKLYDEHLEALYFLRETQEALMLARKKFISMINFHRFWMPDADPVTLRFPLDCIEDFRDWLSKWVWTPLPAHVDAKQVLDSIDFLPIAVLFLLMSFWASTRKRFEAFQAITQTSLGKVTKDKFQLTILTILWNLWLALPLAATLAVLGYALRNVEYPLFVPPLVAGLLTLSPLVFGLQVLALSGSIRGLFVEHFRFSAARTAMVMKHHALRSTLVVFFALQTMIYTSFEMQEYMGTLGRLSFLLLCLLLIETVYALKQVGLSLYLTQKPTQGGAFTEGFWWSVILMIAGAMGFALKGYIETSKVLLGRFTLCLFIWCLFLLGYQLIFRLMFLRRRRIAFDRARQRRAEILAQRARTEDFGGSLESNLPEIEEPVIDLETVSSRSLQLVRSMVLLAGLVACFFVLSSITAAFSFLGKKVWLPFSTPTLYALIIASLLTFVLVQMYRNFPALLDFILLQHFELSPGSGYAIKTITQYGVIILGMLILFPVLGLEWSKFQWCAATFTGGLGFGLRDIFSSLASGLIILTQKPIRIGDTVTIGPNTGSVTRISSLNTTLLDGDRKECIIPNKDVLNDRLTNWSLSDQVKRTVVKVSFPVSISCEVVLPILEQSLKETPLALEIPSPEIALIDIADGHQLYEIRVYVAEISQHSALKTALYTKILTALAAQGISLSVIHTSPL